DVSDEVLEKLRRLCQLWNVRLLPQEKITSHRPLIGPVIVAVKKAIFPIVRYILKDVLHQQRSFNAAAIQLLAEIASDSNTQPHSKSLESAPGQSSSKRIVQ
ncbi:MAG: hypothetical protein KDD64_06335, partial [Bdellovibrionales bacterium]|nr:hypothetical protein [Bdellovibrionales bacterium]